MDIISAYRTTGSYRGAAALCGTTHKTVRRVIERAETDRPPARKDRARNYDPVREVVLEQVKASGGRISAKRLLPAARAAGYAGSDRNFRRLVAQAKVEFRRDHHRGRRPAVWVPGEYLVIDWTVMSDERGRSLHLFAAVLPFSRWRFVRFAVDERAATTMALIAEAFTAAGGVPGKVLADRMACLKGGVVANVVVPTPAYVSFAAHYGFAPDFCQAADPQSKGVVENLVGYAESDLGVPLMTQARLEGRPLGLARANLAAEQWCIEVNSRVHSEICAVPDERLVQEAPLLGRLPSLGLRLGPDPVTRKVDRLSCVRFASARYSVPNRLIGTTVWLVPEGDGLLIVEPATGSVVAEHALAAPGEASVQDEHYDGPRPAPGRGPRPRTAAEQEFCSLGRIAEAFLVGSAAAGNTRLGPELQILLQLRAAHGDHALIEALTRATAFRRWRAEDVRSILAAGTAAPTPTTAGDALVLDLPVAPTRSLADYAITSSILSEATR